MNEFTEQMKQKPYENHKLTDIIKVNWRDVNLIKGEIEICELIKIALNKDSPYLMTKFYFLFGEKHILEVLHDKELNFSDEMKKKIHKTIELCKEIDDED